MASIGEQRYDAGERIWTLLWQGTVGYVLTAIIAIIGTVWAFVDLLWSAVTNRDDLKSDSKPAKWVSATFNWSIGQTIYGLTGGADECWIAFPSKDMAT
jgi:hypothetical protein